MKKQLLGFATLCVAFTGFSQEQLENPGFENWEIVSGTEEPVDWSSLGTGGGNATSAPQVIFKDANAYSGSYCLRMKSGLALGVIVSNGICTNGRVEAPTTNAEDGYVQTYIGDPVWSTEFTSKPDSIIGYYKYAQQGNDRGKVQVSLHEGAYADPNNGTYQGDVSGNKIAIARFDTPRANVSSWTRFSAPFNYINGNTPVHILSVLTSGDSTAAVNGSEMWLDDLELVYNPASIEEQNNISEWSLSVVNKDINLKFDSKNNSEEYFIWDATGRLYQSGTVKSLNQNIIKTNLESGVYIFRLGNKTGVSRQFLIQ